MGLEDAGSNIHGEDFVIETETNPDKEIVRVLDKEGKAIEMTRAEKRAVDLKQV
jgi:hypothetical protein